MKIDLPNLSFEITSECNLACRYCYNHWKAQGNSESDSSKYSSEFQSFNSYSSARKVLSRLFRIAEIKHVTFTGGEPLMAERFQEIVLYTRLKGKGVSIISNGNYGKLTDYQSLVQLGVALFELPVHSHNKEHHDAMTRIKGSWEKSVEKIQELTAMKTQVVAVIVLTKYNFFDIEKTLDFIHSLGVKRVMINRFNIGGEGIKEQQNLLLSKEELNTAYGYASQKASALGLRITSNVCTPVCILNPKDFKGIQFSSCSSDFSKRPVTVDIRGDLRFCNHSPVILGNIFKDDIGSILTSGRAQAWDKERPAFCDGCPAFSMCKAGCRAASEQLGGGLSSPDPLIDIMRLRCEDRPSA